MTEVFERNNSCSYGGASSGGSSGSSGYQVTAPATSNDTVTVPPKSAVSGTKVTITATPDDGYTIGGITVTDSNGNSISVTDNGDGTYTFTMPASKITINAIFSVVEEPESGPSGDTLDGTSWVNSFTDVSENDWFYNEVAYVVQNGLMNGVGNGQFNPSGTTTRGMIMTILARHDGIDTAGGSTWYQAGMEWAIRAGVSDGTAPETDITREQLATMLWRYAGEPSVTGDLSGYPDAGNVHDWASNAMIWAVQNGIINGSDGKLNPQGNALRSETAAMLARYCKNTEK